MPDERCSTPSLLISTLFIRSKMKVLKFKLVLFILLGVPLLFIVLGFTARKMQGPYHQAYNSDPSYPYLLNSLSVASGERPGHTDHPGTTVQLLGGAILKGYSIVDNSTNNFKEFQAKVLKNPEYFLRIINNFLVVLVALTVFLFGLQVFRYTKRLDLAIATQAFPLTFAALLSHLSRVEPEPLLVATAYMLATIIVPFSTSSNADTDKSYRTASIVGIILGFGVVTKITFAPLVLFILIFRGYKIRAFAIIVLLLTILALTIPIWDMLPKTADWIINLATHSGRYGHGNVGLPSPAKLLSSVRLLWRAVPVLFYFIPILLIALLGITRYRKSANQTKLLLILFFVLISHLIIAIKHPCPHYLIPVMAFSCFILLSILLSCSNRYQKISTILITIVSILLIVMATKQTRKEKLHYAKVSDHFTKLESTASAAKCRIINYYRSSSIAYALQFGNGYARNNFQRRLREVYPDYLSYNIWGQFFTSFGGHLSRHKTSLLFQDTTSICLIGTINLPYNGQPKVKLMEAAGSAKLYKFLGWNNPDVTKKERLDN